MTIELEIKALASNPTELQQKIETLYSNTPYTKSYSEQLNHYFSSGNISTLVNNFDELITVYFSSGNISTLVNNFNELITVNEVKELTSSNKLAVRTRWDSNQGTLLIFKYSLIDENSDNGTIRKEIEKSYEGTLIELDNILDESGYIYQSKWSRNRTEYAFDSGWKLLLDINGGYGGILEVEYLPTEEEYATEKDNLLGKANNILTTLGLVELDSELLSEMFSFYSKHFNEFYGTDKLIWSDPRFKFNNLPARIVK